MAGEREECMKICPQCRKPIQDDVRNCPLCGGSIGPAAASGADPGAASPYREAPVQNSGKALASLICGILGVIVLPIVAAILAIIFGHLSLSEIKRSAGRIGGRGMANVGLVLGYLGLAFLPIILFIAAIAIPNLMRAKMVANEASAVGVLRSYSSGLYLYQNMCPEIFYPHSLSALGPGKPSCNHLNALNAQMAVDDIVVHGYHFHYSPGARNAKGEILTFVMTAEPVTPSAGMRHFYLDQTTVIRYQKGEPADSDSPALQ